MVGPVERGVYNGDTVGGDEVVVVVVVVVIILVVCRVSIDCDEIHVLASVTKRSPEGIVGLELCRPLIISPKVAISGVVTTSPPSSFTFSSRCSRGLMELLVV